MFTSAIIKVQTTRTCGRAMGKFKLASTLYTPSETIINTRNTFSSILKTADRINRNA